MRKADYPKSARTTNAYSRPFAIILFQHGIGREQICVHTNLQGRRTAQFRAVKEVHDHVGKDADEPAAKERRATYLEEYERANDVAAFVREAAETARNDEVVATDT